MCEDPGSSPRSRTMTSPRPLLAALVLLTLVSSAVAQGSLIVLNKSDATAAVMSLADGSLRATIPTGDGPHEVAVSPSGRRAVVSDYGGSTPGRTLTVIDLVAAEVEKTN